MVNIYLGGALLAAFIGIALISVAVVDIVQNTDNVWRPPK